MCPATGSWVENRYYRWMVLKASLHLLESDRKFMCKRSRDMPARVRNTRLRQSRSRSLRSARQQCQLRDSPLVVQDRRDRLT